MVSVFIAPRVSWHSSVVLIDVFIHFRYTKLSGFDNIMSYACLHIGKFENKRKNERVWDQVAPNESKSWVFMYRITNCHVKLTCFFILCIGKHLRNHELEYADEKLYEISKMLHCTFEASCLSIKLNWDASKKTDSFLISKRWATFSFKRSPSIFSIFFNDSARFLDNWKFKIVYF